MKKVKKDSSLSLPPQEALQFLEDFRILTSDIDEASKMISIRIPENLLRSLKQKAKLEGKKYQSLMIDYIRKGLRQT